MSVLIRGIIDNEITINYSITNKLNESDIIVGLNLYKEISEEFRKCQSNIDTTTIASIEEFLKNNNNNNLDSDSVIFTSIELWTSFVEKSSNRYNKLFIKSNKLFPSINDLCRGYSDSINKLNSIKNLNIEVRQPDFDFDIN